MQLTFLAFIYIKNVLNVFLKKAETVSIFRKKRDLFASKMQFVESFSKNVLKLAARSKHVAISILYYKICCVRRSFVYFFLNSASTFVPNADVRKSAAFWEVPTHCLFVLIREISSSSSVD
jgi:hypothetical protein